jgi:hypothetical protein
MWPFNLRKSDKNTASHNKEAETEKERKRREEAELAARRKAAMKNPIKGVAYDAFPLMGNEILDSNNNLAVAALAAAAFFETKWSGMLSFLNPVNTVAQGIGNWAAYKIMEEDSRRSPNKKEQATRTDLATAAQTINTSEKPYGQGYDPKPDSTPAVRKNPGYKEVSPGRAGR